MLNGGNNLWVVMLTKFGGKIFVRTLQLLRKLSISVQSSIHQLNCDNTIMKLNLIILLKILILTLITNTSIASSLKAGSMTATDLPPKEAQVVNIGFFPISVHGLDITTNTFYLNSYVWLKWKGDIDPVESMEFISTVDRVNFVKDLLLKEPSILSDGSKYQIMHIEGHFFQKFILSDFPLDKQKLSILVEDSSHGYQQVSYVIDQSSSGIGDQLEVPGWEIKNWNAGSLIHDYGTSFGDNGNTNGGASYSVAFFEININRPSSYFFWKLLLPLLIVVSGAWMSLILDANNTDTRIGMSSTALLTTVFLQQGYTVNLPDIGYLVLMDKIYVLAYVLIVISLARGISSGYFDINITVPSRISVVKKQDQLILVCQIATFLGFIIWSVSNI